MRSALPWVAALASLAGCNKQALNELPSSYSEIHYQGTDAAPPVDVLWMVDNSSSMTDDQSRLASGFSSFIPYLQNLNLDFHMAVVASDMDGTAPDYSNSMWSPGIDSYDGTFQGTTKVMTPQTPSLATAFQQTAELGDQASGVEQGLKAIQAALSAPLLGTSNAGFLRPEATLAVIVLSDENDHSLLPTVPLSDVILGNQGNQALPDWVEAHSIPESEYISFLRGLKGGNASMVSFSAIVNTGASGTCIGNTGSTVGYRYMTVASAFHGVVGDVCSSDYSNVLDQIGGVVAQLVTAFPLRFTPDPAHITVTVNSVVVPQGPSGWTYVPSSNEIVFAAAAAPPQCAAIQIDYNVADYGSGAITGNNEVPPEQCPINGVPQAGGNTLNGGYVSCDVTRASGAPGLGVLAAATMLALGVASRRRRFGE